MKTQIHPALAGRKDVQEADEILRRCVHCGFCTATCPTYQITGDELDGPRGRIYLIKNLLEENDMQSDTVQHLDRCLTCRACETTCPSGVEYGRLLDVGRAIAKDKVTRPLPQRILTALLQFVIPKPYLFVPLLRVGQLFRPVLPRFLKKHVPQRQPARYKEHDVSQSSEQGNPVKVLLLSGCVQSAATPNVTASLAKILAKRGIVTERVSEGCCGSLDLHLSGHEKARQRMKQVIDRLYPRLDDCMGIVSTATGCEVTLNEYPDLLKHDPIYGPRAEALVQKLMEPSELVQGVELAADSRRVAVHVPCSMQHGLKKGLSLELFMKELGFNVVKTRDARQCCGSAGTYSILQPKLSEELRHKKLVGLNADKPDVIVTANVGCQLHLADDTPVVHWLELVAESC